MIIYESRKDESFHFTLETDLPKKLLQFCFLNCFAICCFMINENARILDSLHYSSFLILPSISSFRSPIFDANWSETVQICCMIKKRPDLRSIPPEISALNHTSYRSTLTIQQTSVTS
ncbi:hypothetical protein E2986_08363 [Frieseomelitta varia]|uniref:Uncharacterized protein n=1 Tax=Frieseomelitta varia TaxID=561572 RepID=A0A833WC52_9HYME|nr:hypothetical protein E2986_08363 [Frieseomelitta varia]